MVTERGVPADFWDTTLALTFGRSMSLPARDVYISSKHVLLQRLEKARENNRRGNMAWVSSRPKDKSSAQLLSSSMFLVSHDSNSKPCASAAKLTSGGREEIAKGTKFSFSTARPKDITK